jgi:hypothetical protein
MKLSFPAALLWILLGPFGIFCLVWTFIYAARSEYLSAVVAFGFSIFTLGLVFMSAIIASQKVRPRVVHGNDGIVVRPDRRVDILLIGSTFGVYIAMAVYAVFAPLDMIAIAVPRDDTRYFVLSCGAAILVGTFSVLQIIRRGGTSYVRMTVEGLELGNTVSSVERSWDEVTDVADRAHNARHAGGTTYLMTADGRTRILPSDWYTAGGHRLREFVRFYWKNPEHRNELTDGRALQRLETGD